MHIVDGTSCTLYVKCGEPRAQSSPFSPYEILFILIVFKTTFRTMSFLQICVSSSDQPDILK
jgi:hypothetical protein